MTADLATTSPTLAFPSTAQALRERTDGIRSEAEHALNSLSDRMAALAQEAADLAEVPNLFPKNVIDGLKQFANNTRTSVRIVQSAPVVGK